MIATIDSSLITYNQLITQPEITCSKLAIEILEQGVKYVHFKKSHQNYAMDSGIQSFDKNYNNSDWNEWKK